jgi:hypothetical protein
VLFLIYISCLMISVEINDIYDMTDYSRDDCPGCTW